MNEKEWRQLVNNALNNDEAAFERLYKETERSVYFLCLKLLGNEQDAKDAAQETYLAAFNGLSTLDDGANFPKWINGIAVNQCKRFFRTPQNESLDEKLEHGVDFSDDENFSPDDYVTNAEKRRVIMNIIDTELSEVQRQTIILYYYNELKTHEIASIMNCPEGTVKYRLSAARAKIKEAVLIYEKENKDRLHAIVPIPILTLILRSEAENTVVPNVRLYHNPAASENHLKTGGKTMLNTLKAKIIAGACAAAVVGGGVTAGVVISNNSKNNTTSIPAVSAPANVSKPTNVSKPAEQSTPANNSKPANSSAVESTPKESEEEIKAKRIASDIEYLEQIQPYLLDVSVCDIEDACLKGYGVKESDYSGFDKATILTVGYAYNTTTLQWIDRIKIVDNDGNDVVQTTYNTSWKTTDEDKKLWGIVRYRVAGEYAPEDLKIRLIYKDEYNVSVQKDFSAALGIEEFGQNLYWKEDAKNFDDIKHPFIYKINGKYCFVDETVGTSGGGSFSGEKHTDYVGRGFHITPLEGGLGPVLTKDEVTVESGNTQPYMYCELKKFKEDRVSNSIEINICCVYTDADWYNDDWDSIPEEQKMGAKDIDALLSRYERYEARASYLCVPDGEGGITKIECTRMGL